MQIHFWLGIVQMTPSEPTANKLVPVVCPSICYSMSIKKLSVSSVSKVVLRVC